MFAPAGVVVVVVGGSVGVCRTVSDPRGVGRVARVRWGTGPDGPGPAASGAWSPWGNQAWADQHVDAGAV